MLMGLVGRGHLWSPLFIFGTFNPSNAIDVEEKCPFT